MMKTNNYKQEIPSFINKYKAHILVLIATLGIVLLGCENKAAAKVAGEEQQEYYRLYIVAGDNHTVGIAEDGSLWSWGKNGKGQLGDGTKIDKNIPVRVQKTGTTAGTFVANTTKWKVVVAGSYHTVAIDIDGHLWSWGGNDSGQLGDGTKIAKSTPVRVRQVGETAEAFIDNTMKWNAVAAGDNHTVGIAEDGSLWSWGKNGKGQLGDGTKIAKSTPVRVQKTGTTEEPLVDNITKWKVVAAGSYRTVGIAEDGSLWSWGKNDNGELGDGTTTNKSIPVQVQKKTEEGGFVDNTTKWKAVSTGDNHTVGIDSDGNMWSWGLNDYGQLGDGTKTNKSIPVPVRVQKTGTTEEPLVDNITKWKVVAAGARHTAAIDSDENLWSWGKNDNGELGDGTTTNKSIPVRVQQAGTEPFVDNTTKWKVVSVGDNHTVGIDSDENLWSWGANNSGQLGDGTATNRDTPVKIQISE